MGKIKLTRADVNRCFRRVYRAGYSQLEPLYREGDASGYNSGLYGWNWDLYEMPGRIAITSGYRSMVGAELPARCKKIIQNAVRYRDKMRAAGHYDYPKMEKYIRRARRQFEAELTKGR